MNVTAAVDETTPLGSSTRTLMGSGCRARTGMASVFLLQMVGNGRGSRDSNWTGRMPWTIDCRRPALFYPSADERCVSSSYAAQQGFGYTVEKRWPISLLVGTAVFVLAFAVFALLIGFPEVAGIVAAFTVVLFVILPMYALSLLD
jgi:hypothetical protein